MIKPKPYPFRSSHLSLVTSYLPLTYLANYSFGLLVALRARPKAYQTLSCYKKGLSKTTSLPKSFGRILGGMTWTSVPN